MDYKNLSKFEKLAEFQTANFWRGERHFAAVYLKAVWLNDKAVMDEYERFGDRPYQFITNKRAYDRGLLFGFDGKQLDKHGWLQRPEFLEQEEIPFTVKDKPYSSNYLQIGRGKNGKWTYSVSCSTGNASSSSGLSIWGKVMDSRKDCLKEGLKEMLLHHQLAAERLKDDTCGNFNAKFSCEIVRQVKDMFDELTGRKAVQLSFF